MLTMTQFVLIEAGRAREDKANKRFRRYLVL